MGILNAALTASDVEFQDFKYLTTPQLHYIVRCLNTLGTPYEYGEPTEQGYYVKLAEAFKRVMKNVKVQGSLTVDCANGVGGPKLRELIKYLPPADQGGIDIKVVNDDVINPDRLNFEVRHGWKTNNVEYLALTAPVRCRLCQDKAACSALVQGGAARSVRFAGWRCGPPGVLLLG